MPDGILIKFKMELAGEKHVDISGLFALNANDNLNFGESQGKVVLS